MGQQPQERRHGRAELRALQEAIAALSRVTRIAPCKLQHRDGTRLIPGPPSQQVALDLSPELRQTVKTHFSLNGELSHGIFSTEVHEGV